MASTDLIMCTVVKAERARPADEPGHPNNYTDGGDCLAADGPPWGGVSLGSQETGLASGRGESVDGGQPASMGATTHGHPRGHGNVVRDTARDIIRKVRQFGVVTNKKKYTYKLSAAGKNIPLCFIFEVPVLLSRYNLFFQLKNNNKPELFDGFQTFSSVQCTLASSCICYLSTRVSSQK